MFRELTGSEHVDYRESRSPTSLLLAWISTTHDGLAPPVTCPRSSFLSANIPILHILGSPCTLCTFLSRHLNNGITFLTRQGLHPAVFSFVHIGILDLFERYYFCLLLLLKSKSIIYLKICTVPKSNEK
jgi:hypothetical protein